MRPDPAKLADEAAMWLARHDLGTVDMAAFETWRSQSPDHAVAFARAYAAWEAAADLGADTEDAPVAVGSIAPSARYYVSRRAMVRAAAATGAVTLVGAGFVSSRAMAWTHAKTAIGETKRLPLPDGSLAILNTDSAIAWRFDAWGRRLELDQGEVALDVQAGSTPFSLRHSHDSADLSGGEFNIRSSGARLDLLVVKGSARLSSTGGNRSIVVSNQQASLGGDTPVRVEPASARMLANASAWQRGEIVFDDEPLASAVGEYNRYLSTKIVIADPRIAKIRVGGRFVSTNPATFLEALRTTLDVRVRSTAKGYLLSGQTD